jgi:hypothetical protein
MSMADSIGAHHPFVVGLVQATHLHIAGISILLVS